MKTKLTTTLTVMLFITMILQPHEALAGRKERKAAAAIVAGALIGHAVINSSRRPTHTTVVTCPPVSRPRMITYHPVSTHRYGHGSQRYYSTWPAARSYGSSVSFSTTIVQPQPRVVYVDREVPVYIEKPVPVPVTAPAAAVPGSILGHNYSLRFENSAVYVDISDHLRIYQPRVQGHIAFVQHRAQPGYAWITKSEHPSIW